MIATSGTTKGIKKKSHRCWSTRGLVVNKALRRSSLPFCTTSVSALIALLIVHPLKKSSTLIDGGGLWQLYVIALCLSVNILESALAGPSMFARIVADYLVR